MLFFIILPLLALLPTSFVGAELTSPSFISFISVQKQHIHYLSVALGGSSTSQGSINRHHNHAHRSMSHSVSPSPSASAVSPGSLSSPTPSTSSRHHRHGHISRGHAVSTSPSTTTSGCATCSDPFSSAPFGTPCACVLPMKVRLRLGVSIFSIFPVVSELEIEVAAGTFLKQSQVAITGAVADVQNQEKAVVDFHLLPLGGTFDNTTISLNYQRFLKKEVHLNSSLFGDYDVLLIRYPGFPDLPSSDSLPGAGPKGSTKNPQYPIPADVAGKNEKMNHGIILIIALSAFVLLVVCFGAVVILVHNRKVGISFDVGSLVFTKPMEKRFGKESMQSSSPPTNSAPVSFVSAMPASILSVKTFSLVELEKATEKFSPEKILGEGGFGRVYHGIMENGNEVAVKLLKRDSQNGDSEFIAEIEMLSRLHHCNLVKLIGICIEECSRCLVYELVPNGSIESHIHGADRSKGPLDWAARLKIALGAARGLAYLHEDSNPRVIHRDFKSSNVLLEDDFTPKVSDFGLAREATEGSDLISTRVMGTFGYVAPEYAMTGHLLVKSDVYSYGVVLLELLTGRKPVDMSQIPGQENLVVWARPLLSDQQGLEQLADPTLAGTYDPDDMARVAAIASMCVHPEVTQRPFMGEVVQALKLICNDTDSICGDGYSPEQPSDRYLDINEDSAISEGSWWNPECVSSRQQFVTMELRNSPGLGWDSVEGGVGLPTRHENRSGPLKIIRGNRDYYRLRESMSEHRGLQVKRDLKDVCGYESFF